MIADYKTFVKHAFVQINIILFDYLLRKKIFSSIILLCENISAMSLIEGENIYDFSLQEKETQRRSIKLKRVLQICSLS